MFPRSSARPFGRHLSRHREKKAKQSMPLPSPGCFAALAMTIQENAYGGGLLSVPLSVGGDGTAGATFSGSGSDEGGGGGPAGGPRGGVGAGGPAAAAGGAARHRADRAVGADRHLAKADDDGRLDLVGLLHGVAGIGVRRIVGRTARGQHAEHHQRGKQWAAPFDKAQHTPPQKTRAN